jgi:hypothetical protein
LQVSSKQQPALANRVCASLVKLTEITNHELFMFLATELPRSVERNNWRMIVSEEEWIAMEHSLRSLFANRVRGVSAKGAAS